MECRNKDVLQTLNERFVSFLCVALSFYQVLVPYSHGDVRLLTDSGPLIVLYMSRNRAIIVRFMRYIHGSQKSRAAERATIITG